LELCLKNNVSAAQYDQQIIGINHPDNPNGWMVAPDRIRRVQMCLDYITRRVNELTQKFPGSNVTVESEQKSDPGGAFGRTDWWGTIDITIIARHPMSGEVYFIEVIDYKDGRMYVSEKNNTQLISYLFGKMRKHIASGPDLVRPFHPGAIGGCRMTIVQPKTNPIVRYQCSINPEHEVSPVSVMNAAIDLSDAARATDDPNAPLIPGAHCKWCKANPKRGGHCTAETNQSLEMVMNMSTNEDQLNMDLNHNEDGSFSMFEYLGKAIADPKSLTPDQLADIADAEAGIQAVFDKVKEEIQSRIEQDMVVPGYAMGPGRGSNKWNESDKIIAKKLKGRRLKKDEIYPPTLISPAQVMKLTTLDDDQKERIRKDMISFVAGALTLKKTARVKETKSAEMMFADVPKIESADDAEISFM
jgi:hypothetical protein